jgi:hypothetical protein
MEHLHPNLHHLVQEPSGKRIKELAISPIIGYPLAKKAMERLEDLLVHPPTHRMPNLLLVGNTNNGKTIIADVSCSNTPPIRCPEDFVRVPVVMVQHLPCRTRNGCTRHSRPARRSTQDQRQNRSQATPGDAIAGDRPARMLIIDEIHHVLAAA